MKLKSIASLCKNRKMVYIYSGSGCQYIGQGCACWMVPGTLEVSKGNAHAYWHRHQKQRRCQVDR